MLFYSFVFPLSESDAAVFYFIFVFVVFIIFIFRLFPVELFEIFIDVGHYQKDLDSYSHLVDSFNSLPVCHWIAIALLYYFNVC